ncbi:TonB-dependent receptor [Pseudoalteromonas sp. C2R02]|uniref:TonB-dependent receptor domain-containing protein n=1 Tax=Pseudoalteromonas sp. C2R02 TaxID=2841565 RepID=UPI001C08CC9E|nr:TonB-dependent receptor [Pseudoalteromonas sp. C2R02]MBU2970684.1 TonB-dependent receptor [Pseudoalteromonas sp. C2R02]
MIFSKSSNLVATAVSLALCSSASAQELNNKDDKVIEQISVVGKRVSHANNVVKLDEIERQSPNNSVLAAIKSIPGVIISEGDAFGGDDWSTTISMRGFSTNLNEQQLGMTIDGVPNGGSGYGGGAKANRYIDSENMASVEVAQGTSDISSASLEALGGNLNFITKRLSEEQMTTFAYTNADHDATRYFVRHETGEIAPDTYAMFSYSQTSNKRWIDEGSNAGAERQHFEAKLESWVGDLAITARFSYDDTEEDNYNGVSIEQFNGNPDSDRLTGDWTGTPYYDQNFAEGWSTLRENSLAYVKLDYEISDNSSIQFTPYYHVNKGRGDWMPPYMNAAVDAEGNIVDEDVEDGSTIKYGFTDPDGNPLQPDENCMAEYGGDPMLHPDCYQDDAVAVMSYRHTHYQKNRYGFTTNYNLELDQHNLKTGFWYENSDRSEQRDWHEIIDASQGPSYDEAAYRTQYDRSYTTKTFRWYLQDNINFDALTLNAGVQQYLVDINRVDNFIDKETGKINSDSDLLASLGAVYDISDSLEIFTGFSQNFSAIKDEILESGLADLSEIAPETADNIDLGLRYQTQDLNLSLTAYTINFDNRITFISANTPGAPDYDGENGTYRNDGGIESQGVELSATYHVSSNWSILGSYTNNRSEYASTEISEADGTAGNKVAGAAEDVLSLSANYFNGDLRFGTSMKYTSDRFGDKDNTDVLESATIVDFNLGYAIPIGAGSISAMDVSFVVSNVFDKDYLAGGIEGSYFIGAPRTASLTFTANF